MSRGHAGLDGRLIHGASTFLILSERVVSLLEVSLYKRVHAGAQFERRASSRSVGNAIATRFLCK